MDEKQVNTADRLGLALGGIISLGVGLMFFIPGVYFCYTIIMRFLKNVFPDGPLTFITIFMVTVGAILLLLSYQFFSGKVGRQHMSTPILVFVSMFFIFIGTVIVLTIYVFDCASTDYQIGRAVGGSFTIGGLGLWFAYKRKRGTSNKRIQN